MQDLDGAAHYLEIDRQFVATAFICWHDRVLLHRHRKLNMWLPCGGHIEPGEIPEEAAVREVLEESGVAVELVDEPTLQVAEPRQLLRPRGVQLELIAPGHEHIDLIYFGRPVEPYDGSLSDSEPEMGWYTASELERMSLTEEMRAWTELALRELAGVAVTRTA